MIPVLALIEREQKHLNEVLPFDLLSFEEESSVEIIIRRVAFQE